MKKAHIFWVSASPQPGYAWKWRVGEKQSKQSFDYYFDCISDARERGYEVELSHAVGATAPGGATYRLGATS